MYGVEFCFVFYREGSGGECWSDFDLFYIFVVVGINFFLFIDEWVVGGVFGKYIDFFL